MASDVSMAPLVLPSDKPVVRKANSYQVDDIVVFRKEGKLIAHRLIYRYPNGKFVAKGDNNLKSDGEVNRNRILGKVEKVTRGGQSISLSHVYLSQSSTYLKELQSLNSKLNQARIDHLLLKGLPLHLIYGKLPQRLYLDADILIAKKGYSRTEKILKNLGFEPIEPELLGKSVKDFSQISFVKKVKPFAVIVDIHFSPGIGFTKATGLNRLIPSLSRFTRDLFRNAKKVKIEGSFYPVLTGEDLVLYLLLHLFHHNFGGIHRMEFISRVMKTSKSNMNLVWNKANKYGFEYFIYPSLLTVKRYFPAATLPENPEVPFLVKYLSETILASSPFDEDKKAIEGTKRFLFTFWLSRINLFEKLSVLFSPDFILYLSPTIKSAFSRI